MALLECLPTEILQTIVEQTPKNDLLALRQTSTTLAGATYRYLIKEYIEDLSGFMFNRDRIAGLDRILTSPCFADHVRTLTLTQQRASLAVRRGGIARTETQDGPDAHICSERCVNQCHAEKLRTTMGHVRALQDKRESQGLPALDLKLSFSPDGNNQDLGMSDIMRMGPVYILQAAVESNCCVTGLRMANSYKDIGPLMNAPGGDLRVLVRNLESFWFDIRPDIANRSFDRPTDKDLLRCITTATKLKELTLMLPGVELPAQMNSHGFNDCFPRTLEHSDLSTIRQLRISGSNMTLWSLLEILDRCRETLEGFTLHRTMFLKTGDPVYSLLQHLDGFPKLNSLNFFNIIKVGRPEAEALFLLSDGCTSYATGKVAAKPFLAQNIKSGSIQYVPFIMETPSSPTQLQTMPARTWRT